MMHLQAFLGSKEAQEPLTKNLLKLTVHSPKTSVQEGKLDYFFVTLLNNKEWHDKIQK
ncbi:hypothetical protein H6G26_40870 [Nostoc sp. FACHB-888]|nr:hypothetical protein [Nostoc sp. FACHB-888]